MRVNGKSRIVTVAALVFLFWAASAIATTHTYESTEVPKDIPDPGTVRSNIWVPDSFKVRDVNIKLTIEHPINCDLDVFLIHNGIEVELFTDVGGQVDDFRGTVFDDEAGIGIQAGSPPFEGTFRPEGDLSDFDFTDAHGEWQLRVTDDMSADKGELISWSLMIEDCPPPQAPTGPTPADRATGVPISVCLEWDGTTSPDQVVWDVYFGPDPGNLPLFASGLTSKTVCVDSLLSDTWYYWRVVAKNPCGETSSIGSSGPWRFKTTGAPVLLFRDVIVPADRNCQAIVTIDDIDLGSYDPDGGVITLTLEPPGPYAIGEHIVTLRATNARGASASAKVRVTVLQTAYCCKKTAIVILESILDPANPDVNLLLAIDYLKMSVSEKVDILEESRVFWAGPDRIAHRQGGYGGARVFEFEQKACSLLKDYLATCGAGHADRIDEVWDWVAEADRILADTAIADAAFQRADPTLIAQARTLRQEGNAARNAGGMEIPDVALGKYYQAWQKAVYGLGPATDYNRDGVLDADDVLMFSEDALMALTGP